MIRLLCAVALLIAPITAQAKPAGDRAAVTAAVDRFLGAINADDPVALKASQIPEGMTFVLIIAGIDLSVGSVMALTAAVAGISMVQWHWSLYLALPLAMLVGGCAGLLNGAISVNHGRCDWFMGTAASDRWCYRARLRRHVPNWRTSARSLRWSSLPTVSMRIPGS